MYLHQTGFLYLLNEFYGRVLIPPAVALELDAGKAIGVDLPGLEQVPWISVHAPERLKLDRVPTGVHLGPGESEVLALGLQFPDAVLILDDRLARSCAGELRMHFTGTLGVLVRAKLEGRISRLGPVLERLQELGFRVSSRTHTTVLKLAGEGIG